MAASGCHSKKPVQASRSRQPPHASTYLRFQSEIEAAARRASLKTLLLFLADRAYDAQGRLVARGLPGALVKDEVAVRARVRQFLVDRTVTTIDDVTIDMPAQSILVHSDTPGSLELARIVRSEIEAAGSTLAPASEVAG